MSDVIARIEEHLNLVDQNIMGRNMVVMKPDDLRAILARVAALEGALEKYGRHDDDCNWRLPDAPYPCGCGLDAVLPDEKDPTFHQWISGDYSKEGEA